VVWFGESRKPFFKNRKAAHAHANDFKIVTFQNIPVHHLRPPVMSSYPTSPSPERRSDLPGAHRGFKTSHTMPADHPNSIGSRDVSHVSMHSAHSHSMRATHSQWSSGRYDLWVQGANEIAKEKESKAAFGRQEPSLELQLDMETGTFINHDESDGATADNYHMMKVLIRLIYSLFLVLSIGVACGHSYTFKPPQDRWLKIFAKYELFLVFAGFIQAIALWLLAVRSFAYESIRGIAKPMVRAFLLSLAVRFMVTFITHDYDPQDGTWDFRMVQACELLALSSCIFLLGHQFRSYFKTRERQGDDIFGLAIDYPLYIIAGFMALIFHRERPEGNMFVDVAWMFSIWVEALAMAPQLLLVWRRGQIEFSTAHFMFMIIGSRIFHGIFWFQCFWAYGETNTFAIGTILQVGTQWTLCGHFFWSFCKILFVGRTFREARQSVWAFLKSL